MDTEREIGSEDPREAEQTEDDKPKKKANWPLRIIIALVVLAMLGGGAMVGAQTLFRTESPLPLEREIADLGKRFVMVPGEWADRRIPNRLQATEEQRAQPPDDRAIHGLIDLQEAIAAPSNEAMQRMRRIGVVPEEVPRRVCLAEVCDEEVPRLAV